MKVRELMTEDPISCEPETNLASAASLMWMNDCGTLPVVDYGRLTGIITDRDICIALGTRNHIAAEMLVSDVATHPVETCAPDDTLRSAMATMRRAKVRRLPVVSPAGELVGVLSLNDLVLAAGHRPGQIDVEEIVNTIKAVSEHRAKPQEAKVKTPELAFV